jgi:hypothetical protein
MLDDFVIPKSEDRCELVEKDGQFLADLDTRVSQQCDTVTVCLVPALSFYRSYSLLQFIHCCSFCAEASIHCCSFCTEASIHCCSLFTVAVFVQKLLFTAAVYSLLQFLYRSFFSLLQFLYRSFYSLLQHLYTRARWTPALDVAVPVCCYICSCPLLSFVSWRGRSRMRRLDVRPHSLR